MSKSIVRNGAIDSIAGVLILHMMLIHIQQFVNSDTRFYYYQNLVLSFFMPWFFFKSGMFFSTKEPCQVFKSTLKKLILPFCVYAILGEFIYYMICLVECKEYNICLVILRFIAHGSSNGNLPLWFLLSLFFVRNIINYLTFKGISGNKLICIFLIASLVVFPMYSNCKYIPWYIGNTLIGSLFYLLGFNFKHLQKINIYISLSSYAIMIIFIPSLVNFFKCQIIYGYGICWLLSSWLGIVSINNIFQNVAFLRYNKFLVYLGRHSMRFYCMHWIILIIFVPLIKTQFSNLPDVLFVLLLILLCLIMIPIISFFMQKISCLMSHFLNFR